MGAIASQITSLTIVYSTVYSGADQSKHQSSASLAFVWGIHRGPVNSPHKWSVTRKMFPFDDVIMSNSKGLDDSIRAYFFPILTFKFWICIAYWMYNENNNLNVLYLMQSPGRYIGRAERLIPPKCWVMKQIEVHSTTKNIQLAVKTSLTDNGQHQVIRSRHEFIFYMNIDS